METARAKRSTLRRCPRRRSPSCERESRSRRTERLLLPLAARGALLGLFEISGPALERHDRSLLVALAHQLSLALESAALTEDLHRSASEARLGSLVRHSSELVLVVSADTTISYASPAVERVLGRSQEEVTGLRLSS